MAGSCPHPSVCRASGMSGRPAILSASGCCAVGPTCRSAACPSPVNPTMQASARPRPLASKPSSMSVTSSLRASRGRRADEATGPMIASSSFSAQAVIVQVRSVAGRSLADPGARPAVPRTRRRPGGRPQRRVHGHGDVAAVADPDVDEGMAAGTRRALGGGGSVVEGRGLQQVVPEQPVPYLRPGWSSGCRGRGPRCRRRSLRHRSRRRCAAQSTSFRRPSVALSACARPMRHRGVFGPVGRPWALQWPKFPLQPDAVHGAHGHGFGLDCVDVRRAGVVNGRHPHATGAEGRPGQALAGVCSGMSRSRQSPSAVSITTTGRAGTPAPVLPGRRRPCGRPATGPWPTGSPSLLHGSSPWHPVPAGAPAPDQEAAALRAVGSRSARQGPWRPGVSSAGPGFGGPINKVCGAGAVRRRGHGSRGRVMQPGPDGRRHPPTGQPCFRVPGASRVAARALFQSR